MNETGETLRNLLTCAWLLPLAGCLVSLGWPAASRPGRRDAAWIVGLSLVASCGLSFWAAANWMTAHEWTWTAPVSEQSLTTPATNSSYGGTYYVLAQFGSRAITIDWYIDSLTLAMFMVVSVVALCVTVFAAGYLHSELAAEVHDELARAPGEPVVARPGRFARFFAQLGLFCFSMLGLLLAGNLFQVFVFWELVGLCSYLLIGYYVERRSANRAASKAFIVNRVGDAGFLVGLMILWAHLGTFQFYSASASLASQGASTVTTAAAVERPSLFERLRNFRGEWEFSSDGSAVVLSPVVAAVTETDSTSTIPYPLLIAAGLGILAGCLGKSAQFPLQTWLPDAMEGPTPVSALVHSATMVAAGIYLAARCFPLFLPEVLLVMAYAGAFTMILGATVAIVATDIKRILAFSTMSQLGYMLLGLGVGGWGAALFHLITHACFKSLLFLGAGSVIRGCHHVQDLHKMGGLARRMPVTAGVMMVGVLAMTGLSLPGVRLAGEAIAFSGHHSKEALLASVVAYAQDNAGRHPLLFVFAVLSAGLTALYLFRLWILVFTGPPRNHDIHNHAIESPWIMLAPMVLLAVLAAGLGIGGEQGPVYHWLAESPSSVVSGIAGSPAKHADAGEVGSHPDGHSGPHEVAERLGWLAAVLGTGIAVLIFGTGWFRLQEIPLSVIPLQRFLQQQWYFNELYDAFIVQPVLRISAWCTTFDRRVLDGFLHGTARSLLAVSRWERWVDERIVDGSVNEVAATTRSLGHSLRVVQSGYLRHYILWLSAGVVVVFVMLFAALPR